MAKAVKAEVEIIKPWLKAGAPVNYWKQGDMIIAFPVALEEAPTDHSRSSVFTQSWYNNW